MSGWIKMRVSLYRDPRVIQMADFLADQRVFMDWLTDPVQRTCSQTAYEHVQRNVIVALCVTGLLVTWGTARERGDRSDDDLILRHCWLSTIDAVADVPCFGKAMAEVGWLREHDGDSVLFPKYFKENESPDEKHRRQTAERQSRYRERHNNVTDYVTSNVTGNVTVTTREEKRRSKEGASPRDSGPVWGGALQLLLARGDAEKDARRFIGMLLRDYEERDVVDAFVAAHSAKGDPKGYVRKILESRPKKPKLPPGADRVLAALRTKYGDAVRLRSDGQSFYDPPSGRVWSLDGEQRVAA